MLPLSVGNFVYSPVEGGRGELLQVWRSFDPNETGKELDEEGEVRVSCAELLLTNMSRRPGNHEGKYELVLRCGRGGSFADDGEGFPMPWEVSAGLLWTVNHLVRVEDELLANRIFFFDYEKANEEIAQARARLFGSSSQVDLGAGQLSDRFEDVGLSDADQGTESAEDELMKARQSANEAAELRTRPRLVTPQQKPLSTPDSTRRARQVPDAGSVRTRGTSRRRR